MLAPLHDVVRATVPGFGLKDIARTWVSPRRSHVRRSHRHPRLFREEPDRLMAYAADDAVETLDVSAHPVATYFAQSHSCPSTTRRPCCVSAQPQIDALLLREYVRRGMRVPATAAEPGRGRRGWLSIWHQGVRAPSCTST